MRAIQIAFLLPLSPSFVVAGLWWQPPWLPMVRINSLGDVTWVSAQAPLGEGKGPRTRSAQSTHHLAPFIFLFHPFAQNGEAAQLQNNYSVQALHLLGFR